MDLKILGIVINISGGPDCNSFSSPKEKIAGIEVMKSVIEKCEREEKGIYLLGAEEEILKLCKENIKKEFPNI